MHPDQFQPLTHAELIRLEAFLRSHASGDWAMSLNGAQGFLAAAASGPQGFEPGESIRPIFDEPVFADGEQASEILGLILRLQADVERSLSEPGRLRPLFEFATGSGGRPIPHAGDWCRGYLSATALWGEPLPGQIANLLEPLFLIGRPRGAGQRALRDAHYDELCALLPAAAEAVYQQWHSA